MWPLTTLMENWECAGAAARFFSGWPLQSDRGFSWQDTSVCYHTASAEYRASVRRYWTRQAIPWLYEKVVLEKQAVSIARLKDLPESAKQDRANGVAMGILSFLNIPLFMPGSLMPHLSQCIRRERSWPGGIRSAVAAFREIFINALERRNKEGQLRERLLEIEKLKERLEKEKSTLEMKPSCSVSMRR